MSAAAAFPGVKVADVELGAPIADLDGLAGYSGVLVLGRLHGSPLGYVYLPVDASGVSAGATLRAILLERLDGPILRHLLRDGLTVGSRGAVRVDVPHPECEAPLPSVTVAVCTRDRPEPLASCLDALARLDYPSLDLLVVDNAPSTPATATLVRDRYPAVRYVCEPRPGLDWARNRAILEARGDVLAYTDDDVVVDPGWVKALARVFAEAPDVMGVTGLVVPYELETEAQVLFEANGGFTQKFERQWYRVDAARGERTATRHGHVGRFGTGANMAFRRRFLAEQGGFDPALDVGTATNGGGDLEMFFRVLKAGHTLVYDPDAIVRHRHRRTYAELRTQVRNNGMGFIACTMRSALAYPDERKELLRVLSWWLRFWIGRRWVASLLRRPRVPRELIGVELRGAVRGLGAYHRARREATRIARTFGPVRPGESPC